MKTMPPGWRIAQFTCPAMAMDVLDVAGHLLQTFESGKALCMVSDRGPWPQNARAESWVRSPSGRRVVLEAHYWRKDQWRELNENDPEAPHPLRIHILLDYESHAMDEYHGVCLFTDLGLDPECVQALAQKFQSWEWSFDYWGHWDRENYWGSRCGRAVRENGYALCLELIKWVGPEGVISYWHPPEHLGCGEGQLLLAWEPEPDSCRMSE